MRLFGKEKREGEGRRGVCGQGILDQEAAGTWNGHLCLEGVIRQGTLYSSLQTRTGDV